MSSAVGGQILSSPLLDYNSCSSNVAEKVVVLMLCVVGVFVWFCLFVFLLWVFKKVACAHLCYSIFPLRAHVLVQNMLLQSCGLKTTDESRK